MASPETGLEHLEAHRADGRGKYLDGLADARMPDARLRELFAEYETCFDISREPV